MHIRALHAISIAGKIISINLLHLAISTGDPRMPGLAGQAFFRCAPWTTDERRATTYGAHIAPFFSPFIF